MTDFLTTSTARSRMTTPEAIGVHTPGPWKADGTIYKHMISEIRSGTKGEGQPIAQVWDGPNGFKDALLMAAAPTLFEAVTEARDFLRNRPLESGICCCGDPIAGHNLGSGHAPVDDLAYHSDQIVATLSAAIARATGAA